MKRRQSRAQRKRVDPSEVGVYQRARTDVQRLRAALERLESRRNIRGVPYFEHVDIKAKFSGCGLNLRYFQYRAGIADSPMIANRRKLGIASRKISSRLPASSVD